MNRLLGSSWTKAGIFALCLVPAVWGAADLIRAAAGPNPVEYVTHLTGDWTLRFLLITLLVTPLRNWTNWQMLAKYRRMLGLFAFFYGCLHLTTYLLLDKTFDWGEIWRDVYKRPFITAGTASFLAMVPLAATSTKNWILRLGGKRWQRLHRLIYLSALAGVVHYYWLVKSDIRLPVFYGLMLMLLLSYRVWKTLRLRSTPVPASVPSRARR